MIIDSLGTNTEIICEGLQIGKPFPAGGSASILDFGIWGLWGTVEGGVYVPRPPAAFNRGVMII